MNLKSHICTIQHQYTGNQIWLYSRKFKWGCQLMVETCGWWNYSFGWGVIIEELIFN